MAVATAINAVDPVQPAAVFDEGGSVEEAEERPVVPEETSSVGSTLDGRSEYRCDCGQGLRVFGVGRHRVYFEPGQTRLDEPVMGRACPACGSGLPGKNPP